MRTRTRSILAGLVLAAALVGGVAWATIPDGNGLYTACKLNATGTIRLIDPSGPSTSLLSRCTSHETKITWNQKGLKGEPGSTGANGANGAPGTNGVNGVDGAPGPQGPAGPQGPSGSGSAGPASLDGLACNAAGTAGTVVATYGPPPAGEILALACKPTSTPTLTVTKAGAGSGTVVGIGGIECGATCSQSYTVGTYLVLAAYAAEGDVFTGWSGACTGTETQCAVTMNAAVNVTAHFAVAVELTISQSAESGFDSYWTVSLTSEPGGIWCEFYPTESWCGSKFGIGTTVTVTSMHPNVAWGGACAGATGVTCTLTLDANKNVTVRYSP